jgi:nicotinate-nucleotide adenylyltransferase
LGGTFDPIHLGHLRIIEKLAPKFDEIFLIPAGQPQLRDGQPTATAEDRLEMCAAALDDLSDALQEKVSLLDIEIKRTGATFTVDTLSQLRAFFPKYEFTLVIGSDAATGFGKWKKSAEIQKSTPILVVRRPGSAKSDFPEIEIDALDISATEIRESFSSKKSAPSVLSPSVSAYITKRGLYGSK